MVESLPHIRWERSQGATRDLGGVHVTPESHALLITGSSDAAGSPARTAGLVWNRPTALLVERDGVTARVRIVDVTRTMVLVLGIATIIMGWIAAIASGSAGEEGAHE